MLKDKFLNDGYVILRNVIPNELLENLSVLSKLYIKRTYKRQKKQGNAGFKLFRSENLLSDFPVPDLFNNDDIHNLLSNLLGKNYTLNEVLIYFSEPNNRLQELHRDKNHLFTNQIIKEPHFIAVQIPLVDFNYASGGTRIISGTHLNLDEPTREENEDLDSIKSYTPQVQKGDCLLRDCRTWHGAGINTSNSIRAMFTLAFSKDWYGQKPNVSADVYMNIKKEYRHVVSCELFKFAF